MVSENMVLFDDRYKPIDHAYIFLEGAATIYVRSKMNKPKKKIQIGNILISEVPLIRHRARPEEYDCVQIATTTTGSSSSKL